MRRTPPNKESPAPTTSTILRIAGLVMAAALLSISGSPQTRRPRPGKGSSHFSGTTSPGRSALQSLANNTNPCLLEQLAWAEDSAGHPGQPTVSLYVNTANPGAAGSWWPENDEYPAGKAVHNPDGPCKAGDYGKACAYMYGFAKAHDDAHLRGISNPSAYFWWLDVETENTWSSTDKDANRTVLEGMTDFFHSIGAQVGIYSTRQQWGRIVGTVSSSSNLYALPSWLAGSLNASGAARACSQAPLTAGGRVALTQFVSRGFDYNYSCT